MMMPTLEHRLYNTLSDGKIIKKEDIGNLRRPEMNSLETVKEYDNVFDFSETKSQLHLLTFCALLATVRI